MLRTVARRRLVKTENPRACATVNWKVCKSAIVLYLIVIKRTCNKGANKSKLEPVTLLHVTVRSSPGFYDAAGTYRHVCHLHAQIT
jgi:hypothetical protein